MTDEKKKADITKAFLRVYTRHYGDRAAYEAGVVELAKQRMPGAPSETVAWFVRLGLMLFDGMEGRA